MDNKTFGQTCNRYISIRYCHEQAHEKNILNNLRCYYDRKNGELVGIEIGDPALLVKEITDLLKQEHL